MILLKKKYCIIKQFLKLKAQRHVETNWRFQIYFPNGLDKTCTWRDIVCWTYKDLPRGAFDKGLKYYTIKHLQLWV